MSKSRKIGLKNHPIFSARYLHPELVEIVGALNETLHTPILLPYWKLMGMGRSGFPYFHINFSSALNELGRTGPIPKVGGLQRLVLLLLPTFLRNQSWWPWHHLGCLAAVVEVM
jgi:hypothetical protein